MNELDDTAIREGGFSELVARRLRTESEDYDISANGVLFTLVRAANLLSNDLDSAVWREFGLSYAGHRVLFVVWVAGPLEPRDIARYASVSRASISSVINTLERDGLVLRERTSTDRRLVTVRLTEKGRGLWEGSYRLHNERERAWMQAFSEAERATLTELLRKLIRSRPRS